MNTCKTCKHYRPRPTTALTLGQGAIGECRERLHILPFPVALSNGQIDMQIKITFPHVPESLEACGQWKPQEVTGD